MMQARNLSVFGAAILALGIMAGCESREEERTPPAGAQAPLSAPGSTGSAAQPNQPAGATNPDTGAAH